MVPSRQASAAGQNGCVPAGSFKRFNSVAKSITTGMQAGGTSMPRARRWLVPHVHHEGILLWPRMAQEHRLPRESVLRAQ